MARLTREQKINVQIERKKKVIEELRTYEDGKKLKKFIPIYVIGGILTVIALLTFAVAGAMNKTIIAVLGVLCLIPGVVLLLIGVTAGSKACRRTRQAGTAIPKFEEQIKKLEALRDTPVVKKAKAPKVVDVKPVENYDDEIKVLKIAKNAEVIAKYKQLLDEGAITEKEFEAQKAELLK